MRLLKVIMEVLAAFVCAGAILPFIKTDQWWIRVFDFPRAQFFILGAVLLLVFLVFWRNGTTLDRTFIGLLLLSLIVQGWQIAPYTPLKSPEVKQHQGGEATIRVFVANVLQENTNYAKLLEQIRAADPDVILLNEANDRWTADLSALESSHPHKVLNPQSNTYGMNLYSRFELIEPEVRFLTDPGIPSIRTGIKVPGHLLINFYGVHPRPPARKNKEDRNDSTQRDAELVVIAREIRDLDGPVIVAGDFNDVAWSHTTGLFQRIGRLLDPRVGRGFYNTYNAKNPLLRLPLDHLFHSDHFTLVDMDRLGYFGSDHFPIYAGLYFQPEAPKKQEAPPEKANDAEETKEILQRKQ